MTELSFDVGVNGFSFTDGDSLQMVSEVPLATLQIETDTPWVEVKDGDEIWKRYGAHYQNKEPERKKKDKWQEACMDKDRNESCCMEKAAFVVAGCQGRSVHEIAGAAWTSSMKISGQKRSIECQSPTPKTWSAGVSDDNAAPAAAAKAAGHIGPALLNLRAKVPESTKTANDEGTLSD